MANKDKPEAMTADHLDSADLNQKADRSLVKSVFNSMAIYSYSFPRSMN